MMLRGSSSCQGRCLQSTAECRSAALHHRPVARCSAVSRRQVVVQARGPPRGGNDREKEKEKEKEKGKKEKKKGREKEEEEDSRISRRAAWDQGVEGNTSSSSHRRAWDKEDYYSEFQEVSEQDRDDDSTDLPKQPKGLKFIGGGSNSSASTHSTSSTPGARFMQPSTATATTTTTTTTTVTTSTTGLSNQTPATSGWTATTVTTATINASATFLPGLSQIKEYWSDPETVFKAANLPAAALLCAKDVNGSSTVLDFLNHFPMFGVAATSSLEPGKYTKPQEVALECVMSCNSDEIFPSAQPPTSNKPPDQRKRRTLCDLPWTTNYFICEVSKPPGQLSDKARKAIFSDQMAEYQKNVQGGKYGDEKLGTEKVPKSRKGSDWQEDEEQLAAIEQKYMWSLNAAQQEPRRRIAIRESESMFGPNEYKIYSTLSKPEELEGYSWVARKAIQAQTLQAAANVTLDGLKTAAKQNVLLSATGSNTPTIPLDGIVLWPPDTTKPLDQQNRVAIVELPNTDVFFACTMLCWAPTKVATSSDPNAAKVDTLVLSCVRTQTASESIDPVAVLVRQYATVLQLKNEPPAGKQGGQIMPDNRDNYLLTTTMLKDVSKEKRMTVIAVWHQDDNPPNWRLFVQIQSLPSYNRDQKGRPLPVDVHHYRPEPNKLIGAVQIYPLGYTSPYTGQKVTTVDEALKIPAQAEAHLVQDNWSWTSSAPTASMVWPKGPSASRFPRFHTAPLEAALKDYAEKGDTSLKDALDSEGVDLVQKHKLNEAANKSGKGSKS